MPRWNEGLVDAFPVPLDEHVAKLTLKDQDLEESQAENEIASLPYNPDPFRFFSLPGEIRNRIYHLVLFSKPPYRSSSGKRKGSRISLLLVSKRFHKESSYTLYTTHKFLIFPLQEFEALPTIQELPLHYRVLVSNLRMIVGSSWTSPPRSWRVSKSMRRCLANLKNVQTVSVFVEFDPSHPAFRRFRISETFYTDFCGELLEDVLDAMPQAQYVQLDGNPGVDVHGPLVSRLRDEALEQEKEIKWGKEAGWAHTAHDMGSIEGVLKARYNPLKGQDKIHSTSKLNIANQTPFLQNKVLERVKDL